MADQDLVYGGTPPASDVREEQETSPADISGSPVRGERARVSEVWDSVLDVVVKPKTGFVLSPEKRADCEAARILFLGTVGYEDEMYLQNNRDKERAFYEKLGKKEEVLKMARAFRSMDLDCSGRVHLSELRGYATKFDPGPFGPLAARVEKLLLSKKSSFTVEDLMRLLWPCAGLKELRQMQNLVNNTRRSTLVRVKTPPVLSPAEYEGLKETFRYFDEDESGTVTYQELVRTGLLDQEQACRYMADWDRSGDGMVNEAEFCEMFCPTGFRAFSGAKVATDPEGNRLEFDEGAGWRYAAAAEEC